MKYIKHYESEIDRYWLVPTDERLIPSLEKIGADFNLTQNSGIKKYKYVFIGLYMNSWVWAVYDGEERNESFERNGNEYAGRVNIPDYEINANKYNL